MLLLQLRWKVSSGRSFAQSGSELMFERLPEHHKGAGHLWLMGTRNVSFPVIYDIVLVRLVEADDTAPRMTLTGKVRCMAGESGRPLPEGVYALDKLPECRISHFSDTWSMHFS